MKKLKLSVHGYRQSRLREIEEKHGFVSTAQKELIEIDVKDYAEARATYKRGIIQKEKNFNPFTDDPNCKTCRKKK